MSGDGQLQVILKEQNVAQENAQALIKAFGAPFEEAGEILKNYETIKVTEEDQFDLMAEARSKRLTLKNIRVSVEKRRKELKEDSLRTSRAIDSVAKFIKESIEPAEKYLEDQEKFAEIRKAERAAKLKAERIEKLMQFTDDLSLYNLDDMSQDQFDTLLANLKQQHEAKIAEQKRLEEERIAKEKAEAEERERIRQENERLKAEAAAREAELQKEREAERKRLAKIEAERQKELAIEREKAEAERKKREALEAEARAKAAEEARLKAEAEEAERKSLLAPDKEKLIAFAQIIDAIEPPHVSNREAGKVLDETMDFLERISRNLRTKAKEL